MFMYVGFMFIASGQVTEESRSRVNRACSAFRACNPVLGRGVKYRCVQRTWPTRQWCDRFCSAVAKRGQCEWLMKGYWRSLITLASATFYTLDAEIAYQHQNCGTAH